MWLFIFELLEIPVTWKKVRGGAEVDWIGYHLNVATFERGINDSKKAWILKWIDDKLSQGGVLGRELKSVLGRLSFVAGALRHVAPLFSWASVLAGGTFAKFPDAVVILLEYVREEVSRKPVRSLEPLLTSPSDIFRVDAKAAGEEIVIGGWETWGASTPREARWFSFRLNRKSAPWAYLRGDPFRAIASLELVGGLAAVMVFAPGSAWAEGDVAVTLGALTDNLGNTHVLKKYASSRYPLSIIAMELASQLDRKGVDLDLQWVPRWQNQEADDLTNERFDDFFESKRIEVRFEELKFVVMDKLLQKAGELDEELKLHKTSKEAKRATMSTEDFEIKLQMLISAKRETARALAAAAAKEREAQAQAESIKQEIDNVFANEVEGEDVSFGTRLVACLVYILPLMDGFHFGLPLLDALAMFPTNEDFQSGNVYRRDEGGFVEDETRWTFATIPQMVKEACPDACTYIIYGHSAGGQFTHRFCYFDKLLQSKHPDFPVIERALIANPGWYTMPDISVSYPYGLKDTPLAYDRNLLEDFVRLPKRLLLGMADTDTDDKDLRKTPEANAQGPHRLARGEMYVKKHQALQESLDLSGESGMEVVFVEGAGHSNAQMSSVAFDHSGLLDETEITRPE
eukprot:g29109.t1